MSKFKVGDKVEVICNSGSDFDGIRVGDIGTVVDISSCKSDEYPISLKIGKHEEYSFKEDELKLVVDDDFKLETNNNTYELVEYPVGLIPREIWLKKRKQEILDAIIRYTEAEIMIPIEWAKELRELEEGGV